MLKLFLGIFRRDKSIFKIIFTLVSDPGQWLTGQVGRPHGRPNQGPVDRAVDRRAQPCARLADTGPVDRLVDRTWEPCSLYLGGRPAGRSELRVCSLYLGGRPGLPNGHIFDRWRSTGRSTASLSGWQINLTASFLFGLYKPHFFGILAKIFWANFSPFYGFKKKFSKEFKVQKDSFCLF